MSKGGSRPTFFLSWVAKLFKKSSLGANTNATYQPKSVKKCAKKLFFPKKMLNMVMLNMNICFAEFLRFGKTQIFEIAGLKTGRQNVS